MEKLLHERLMECAELKYEYTVTVNDNEYRLDEDCASDLAEEIERYYIPRPRFEDGEPVPWHALDLVWGGKENYSFNMLADTGTPMAYGGGLFLKVAEMTDDGFVKRPTSKVYDAEGVDIKVGDTVYDIEAYKQGNSYWGKPLTVMSFNKTHVTVHKDGCGTNITKPLDCFTHERPVFDAEGVMICKGDEGWSNLSGNKLAPVVGFTEDKFGMKVELEDGCWIEPINFTHREPDSLEKLATDITKWLDNEPSSLDEVKALSTVHSRLTALIERGE